MFTLRHNVRFITATSLFDGHDAAIHIMRRILQSEGAEVIHLGHNRSAEDVVNAAIQEDAHAIAVSCYQGGHVEYFTYILDLLKEKNASHIKLFGGGGGVIIPAEIDYLHSRGVSRIFSPDDGRKMGLVGMIQHMLAQCDYVVGEPTDKGENVARALTTIELGLEDNAPEKYRHAAQKILSSIRTQKKCPIIGITGTGGAGKSSLVDELLIRFLETFKNLRVGVLTVDPSRRKTGGALLGDRIRLNAAANPRVFVRSMATRRAHLATNKNVKQSLEVLATSGFDVVFLETAGIGQSDSEVSDVADLSVYVMTPEFGAPTQLEKIDMLDYADLVVINKFDKKGAHDALREVQKTYQRNRRLFDQSPHAMPVYGTSAHKFNDLGTNKFFNALFSLLLTKTRDSKWKFEHLPEGDADRSALIAHGRSNYLREIAQTVKNYKQRVFEQKSYINKVENLTESLKEVGSDKKIEELIHRYKEKISDDAQHALEIFPHAKKEFQTPEHNYVVRGKTIHVNNFTESLSHLSIPKISTPDFDSPGEIVDFMMLENFPGSFPFTAGVFPYKRQEEDPTRMFAGEGTPERTNQRFHFLCKGQPAKRLSTAFDSVTLYGEDPHQRPDIYGKVGNSGVSVCSLDDAKRLYSGFDLLAPNTSVSMTINGPAPTILAFFLNACIDSTCERVLKQQGKWDEVAKKISHWFTTRNILPPRFRATLAEGHDGFGLGFLGLPADVVVEKGFYEAIKKEALEKVRGTVQADILKEDQAQNTCIFSAEFGLKMMADVQAYFIAKKINNFYSVSISGYHMAEAGAGPITQLAFTLANGFTFVEYYRARGMDVSAFAPNLSFFFSNGLNPEYSVIGRVARRIWAVAMKHLYGADERSQKLKYHIQTSGRSLHAQEIAFNDIRTTLQALYAILDNCNSLHTNAYDEAITTPTEESVRRAVAIQMIINKELGLTKNENFLQGSFFIKQLTNLVEDAVLKEFEALDERGGVLGAMELMYQRSKIQEESMEYESKKHSGELPIVGVNTYVNASEIPTGPPALIRSTSDEKNMQVDQVTYLKKVFAREQAEALDKLKKIAKSDANIFEELMETSKYCTLGMITHALYEVGGAYRRNM